MHLDDMFRNKPSEKAELFNNYFYEQFSDPSNYNTYIDFSNDQVFDIDFNRNREHKHLPISTLVKSLKIVRKALHILLHSFQNLVLY